MNLHNIKRLLERKCLSLPKNIKSQNKSVAMEIKLDRKKNHIAASDYKEQTTVIKTTSDFKIGNNVDTNKIEGNYMVKREKETTIIIKILRKGPGYKFWRLKNVSDSAMSVGVSLFIA